MNLAHTCKKKVKSIYHNHKRTINYLLHRAELVAQLDNARLPIPEAKYIIGLCSFDPPFLIRFEMI